MWPIIYDFASEVICLWLIDGKHGPLTRYVKLRVAHVPGMLGAISPPPTSKETACWRPRHASRHMLHARAMIMSGSLNPRWWGKCFWHSHTCATRNITYLVRGPCHHVNWWVPNCGLPDGLVMSSMWGWDHISKHFKIMLIISESFLHNFL